MYANGKPWVTGSLSGHKAGAADMSYDAGRGFTVCGQAKNWYRSLPNSTVSSPK